MDPVGLAFAVAVLKNRVAELEAIVAEQARAADESRRAAARMLDPEWLAERLWRVRQDPTLEAREAARQIIAEAKKP